jgi:hypothetical protein
LGHGTAPAFGCPGADQVTLNIGEASEDSEHQASGSAGAVGPRFGQGSELRLGVHDALDDAEQVEGAAGRGGRSSVLTLADQLIE